MTRRRRPLSRRLAVWLPVAYLVLLGVTWALRSTSLNAPPPPGSGPLALRPVDVVLLYLVHGLAGFAPGWDALDGAPEAVRLGAWIAANAMLLALVGASVDLLRGAPRD